MNNYRVITDGFAGFAVEITHAHGGIQTTSGFHTLLGADAWMADRISVEEAASTYRAKLIADMTEATDELRNLGLALAAHSVKLREAARMAHARATILREMARILAESANARRDYADAARKHQYKQ